MRYLVFGRTGQVATELARLIPDAIFLDRTAVDLSDPEACAAAVMAHDADAVINAAADTAVDRAEQEETRATVVNGAAPGAMAQACAARDLPFVHLSTDYVFDGKGTAPFAPDDPVSPQNAYGRSKLAGEVAVRGAAGRHAILRTSWVFSAHGGNFVKTMLRLAQTRETLSVVDDQVGGPTQADAIAAACLTIAQRLRTSPDLSGTYHFSGAPDVSWADFAREIFARAGRMTTVTGLPGAAYPTPARRPANSRLDCRSTQAAFDLERPDWRAGLDRVLAQLGDSAADGEAKTESGATERRRP